MWNSTALTLESIVPATRSLTGAQLSVELSVVMPCYNESELVEPLLREWSAALEKNVGAYEIIVINDGSTDGTGRILDRLRKELKGLRVVHQLNAGHDRAIRRGYELARGHYVLQVDGNGRYEVSDFLRLWELREQYALILAHRTHCLDSLPRRGLNAILGLTSRVLFGTQLKDPNVPFRLVRRELAQIYIRKLSAASEAVNLSMSVLISRDFPASVVQVAVPYRARSVGQRHCAPWAFLGIWSQLVNDLIRLRFSLMTLSLPRTPQVSLAKP